MSMIESFPTSESNYPAQKADNSDDDLVFIMNVKRKDGTADRVVVRPSDDPYKLALDYVQKYKLSDNVVEKLANKIDSQRRAFLLSVLERENSNHQNRIDEETNVDKEVPEQEKSLNTTAANSPPQGLAENFLSQFVPAMGTMIEASKDSKIDIPASSPSSIGAEAENAYNRAKGQWQQLSSPPLAMDQSDGGYHRNSLMSPDIYIHSPLPGKSIIGNSTSKASSSPSNTVFQRLYDSASKFKERQSIRKKIAEEKELEDIRSSKFSLPESSPYSTKNFRSVSAYPGKNAGEKLYASGQVWSKRVDSYLDSERKKKAQKQKEDDKNLLTFKPNVISLPSKVARKIESRHHQPAYMELYEHQVIHEKIVDELKNDHDKILKVETPFQPHVDSRSISLSAHARARRKAIESMISNETVGGKSNTGDSQLTRRKSVWKALQADFPLHNFDHTDDCDASRRSSTPLSARRESQVRFKEPETTGNLSSLFQEVDGSITPRDEKKDLAKMLHEDSVRVGELIEEQRKKSTEKEGDSSGESPSSSKHKFYVPSPGGGVLRSPVFRSMDTDKQQIMLSPKEIDPSKNKIGELDPKTVQDFKSAQSRLIG